MRFNRLAVATAAAVLTIGTTAVLPMVASAQDTTTSTTEAVGPKTTVTNVALSCPIELLGTSVDFPLTTTVVTPGGLQVGDSGELSITYDLGIPDDLKDLIAANASSISNLQLSASLTGGGSGGPYLASPTSFDVTPMGKTLTAGGSFTINSTEDAILAITNPVSFTVSVAVGDGLVIPITCSAGPTNIAALTGELPPVTPTTAKPGTTTTTVKGGAKNDAKATNPNYTG